MTLGRKMLLTNAALLIALVLLASVTTRGLLGLRSSVGTVLQAYRQLQRIENAETSVITARNSLIRGQIAGPAFADPLHSAQARLIEFFNVKGYDYATGDAATAIQGVRESFAGLNNLLQVAEPAPGAPPVAMSLAEVTQRTDQVAGALHNAANACDNFIRQQQQATDHHFRATLISVTTLSGLILLTAVLLSVSQYRGVVLPLHRLRDAIRRVAKGHFQERIEIDADPEFQSLVHEFNEMAEKLDDFYERLEQRVAEKSRELVRSERLASVGFLAAGVAHEINNPLNIISGYAELSLKKLRSDRSLGNEPTKALQIIRDEAFRCKEITQKLLSLARGSGETRVPVSLPKVAQDIASMVGGLSRYSDRRLVLDFEDGRALTILGNVAEMKQVLLNLTINALEATRPGLGEVRIQGRRQATGIELSIRDNGRGMTRETLDHVFEPFFTDKRGAGDPGTGLGLTITHAIIESHGGQITAQSEGVGHGSQFVIRLPAAAKGREMEAVV